MFLRFQESSQIRKQRSCIETPSWWACVVFVVFNILNNNIITTRATIEQLNNLPFVERVDAQSAMLSMMTARSLVRKHKTTLWEGVPLVRKGDQPSVKPRPHWEYTSFVLGVCYVFEISRTKPNPQTAVLHWSPFMMGMCCVCRFQHIKQQRNNNTCNHWAT